MKTIFLVDYYVTVSEPILYRLTTVNFNSLAFEFILIA